MKKIIIILAVLLSLIILYYAGANIVSNFNLKKEKKELLNKIKKLEYSDDSLRKLGEQREKEYKILENDYNKGLIKFDSLNTQYHKMSTIALESESKINYFRNKYDETKNKINYLDKNITIIKGDTLLKSLSKKIN